MSVFAKKSSEEWSLLYEFPAYFILHFQCSSAVLSV